MPVAAPASFTFAAYGKLRAVHGATGTALPVSAALPSLGYSGERFDAKAQQQYLRARWYDPASGRFKRLDPFAGNMQDPQSLHKYAYVHGDPIMGADPTDSTAANRRKPILCPFPAANMDEPAARIHIMKVEPAQF